MLKPSTWLILATVSVALVAQPLRPVYVKGHSMLPTFTPGELVWTSRWGSDLNRGAVVVFRVDGERMVKRIALLPGDRYPTYRVGRQWVTTQSQLATRTLTRHHALRRDVTIPADTVYVLGDNVDRSVDSRDYGPVSIRDIEGVVLDDRPFNVMGFFPGTALANVTDVARR